MQAEAAKVFDHSLEDDERSVVRSASILEHQTGQDDHALGVNVGVASRTFSISAYPDQSLSHNCTRTYLKMVGRMNIRTYKLVRAAPATGRRSAH